MLWKNDLRTVYSGLVDIHDSMGSGWLLLTLVLENWEKSYFFGKLLNQPVTGACPPACSDILCNRTEKALRQIECKWKLKHRGRKGVAFQITLNPLGPALQPAQVENLISWSIAPCRGSNIPFHPKVNLGEQGLHMCCSQRERWQGYLSLLQSLLWSSVCYDVWFSTSDKNGIFWYLCRLKTNITHWNSCSKKEDTGEKNINIYLYIFIYKIQFSNISCFRPASLPDVPQNQS